MKVSKINTFFVSMTLFGSLLSAAGMYPPSFESIDLDKNGYISKQEFDSSKKARTIQNKNDGRMLRNADYSLVFTNIDTNKDGKVTTQELYMGQQMQRNRQNRNMPRGRGRTFR